jgi:hypothetical protein
VQAVRGLLSETDAVLRDGRILICDRDPNWTDAMEELLRTVGVRVIRTPPASPDVTIQETLDWFDLHLGSPGMNRVPGYGVEAR